MWRPVYQNIKGFMELRVDNQLDEQTEVGQY